MTAIAPRLWLTLLLQGGHRESLSIEANSPLLDKLRDTLTGMLPSPWIFEIPIREGAGLLTVHSSQIIGAITEPPVPLTLPAHGQLPLPASVITVPSAPVQISVAGTGFAEGFSTARAIRVENVLTTEQHTALVQFASRNRQVFATSTTTTGYANYRDSLVCFSFPPFDDLLRHRVRLLLPKVAAQLELTLPEGDIEIQLTAHNDGHFYKMHNDNGSEAQKLRHISFVYYFNRSPKSFSGGALRLHDRQVDKGLLTAAATYKDIEPLDNSLVFFDSRELHEVLPVICPSRAFADSRFTINGWAARKADMAS